MRAVLHFFVGKKAKVLHCVHRYWNTYHGSSALKLALLVADAQERPGVSLLNANSEVSGGSLKITMKVGDLPHRCADKSV